LKVLDLFFLDWSVWFSLPFWIVEQRPSEISFSNVFLKGND